MFEEFDRIINDFYKAADELIERLENWERE